MAKLQLSLSPLAKLAALAAVIGVALGIWNYFGAPGWVMPTSRAIVFVAFAVYVFERARMMRRK